MISKTESASGASETKYNAARASTNQNGASQTNADENSRSALSDMSLELELKELLQCPGLEGNPECILRMLTRDKKEYLGQYRKEVTEEKTCKEILAKAGIDDEEWGSTDEWTSDEWTTEEGSSDVEDSGGDSLIRNEQEGTHPPSRE